MMEFYLSTWKAEAMTLAPAEMEAMIARETWHERGACRTGNASLVDLFFSEKVVDQERAKEICETCPIRESCGDRALRNKEEFGTWGALDEVGRRRLIRGRQLTGNPRGRPPKKPIVQAS